MEQYDKVPDNCIIRMNDEMHDYARNIARDTIPKMFEPVKVIIIDGTINNIPIKIMVDTSAKGSFIFSPIVDKLDMVDMIDTRVSGIGYGIYLSIGRLWMVDLKIGGYAYMAKLDVLYEESTLYDVIIGLDFLSMCKANINFALNKITINNRRDIDFNINTR